MTVSVGDKLSGKVASITKFGAFINLETKQTGLVHISEVSHTFVNDINDVLSVGDKVQVIVTAITTDGKISLSIKQAVIPSEKDSKPSSKKLETTQEMPRRLPKFSEPSKQKKTEDFDALMSAFLKDSDERLLSLKRNTEGKRGGRGGRRS